MTRCISRQRPVYAKAAIATLMLCAAAVTASAAGGDAPASGGITLDQSVTAALASDYRVVSAAIDLESARVQERAARLRRLPSLSVSGSYTQLSHVDSSITLGALGTIDFGSQDSAISLATNLQYPVFAGFRLSESVKLAALQTRGKEIAETMTRNAVAFETVRAYWEAVRAGLNAETLAENLELTQKNYDVTLKKVAQGTALNADLLAAGMRRDQARMDLADAVALRDRSLYYLSSLVNAETGASFGAAVNPTSDPSVSILPAAVADLLVAADAVSNDSGDAGTSAGNSATVPASVPAPAMIAAVDAALVEYALAHRPETALSDLTDKVAAGSKKLAEAPLYPTVAVTGNYTYANPNQRVMFSDNEFNGTWAVGVALSYDLGGLPANLKAAEAKGVDARKASSDGDRTAETVVLDVRNCRLALDRARGDLELVAAMLGQAKENERVTAQRVKNGTASDLDFLTASFARVRSEFAIVNKEIDCRVAEADLARALGVPVGVTR